jgi:hypothetical protein
MRMVLVVLLGFLATLARAGEPASRYGVAPDLKTYPQATAKEALGSVLKAIDANKFDYLVAQLAKPGFVDDRVKRLHAGKFEEQVQDTRARLDPATVKLLRRFLADGKWTEEKTSAVVTLEDVKDRVVRLTRKDGRWFLDHSSAPTR